MISDWDAQYDKLYRYCYFKLGQPQAAEDITQETLLRYWEHYHPLPQALAVKYLYTIARNLCVDEQRRQKTLPLQEALPAAPMEDRLLTELTVHSALSALSMEDRELLLLRYVNDVPVGTIAKLLGLSRFAVYRRLKAAAQHFRTQLNKEDKP